MSAAAAPARAPRALPVPSGRPLVMGVLNVTPDSFYAGSRRPALEEALRLGLELEAEGADMVDVGGESTRPGSEGVDAEEESRRVLPVVEVLAARLRVPVSVDTSKAEVAVRALDAGARILNDVAALRGPGMLEAALRYPAVVLMHMRGEPRTMQDAPRYGDVVAEVLSFLRERLAAFAAAGGDPARAWVDPGLGFGKTTAHNLEIMARLGEFRALGRPLLVGASRKSFLGRILGSESAPLPPEERLEASLAAALRAAEAGAWAVRVHDAGATRRALDAWRAMGGGRR